MVAWLYLLLLRVRSSFFEYISSLFSLSSPSPVFFSSSYSRPVTPFTPLRPCHSRRVDDVYHVTPVNPVTPITPVTPVTLLPCHPPQPCHPSQPYHARHPCHPVTPFTQSPMLLHHHPLHNPSWRWWRTIRRGRKEVHWVNKTVSVFLPRSVHCKNSACFVVAPFPGFNPP